MSLSDSQISSSLQRCRLIIPLAICSSDITGVDVNACLTSSSNSSSGSSPRTAWIIASTSMPGSSRSSSERALSLLTASLILSDSGNTSLDVGDVLLR